MALGRQLNYLAVGNQSQLAPIERCNELLNSLRGPALEFIRLFKLHRKNILRPLSDSKLVMIEIEIGINHLTTLHYQLGITMLNLLSTIVRI